MDAEPHCFSPHANLSDEVNHNIVQSEIDGGVHLSNLSPESVLQIQTQHRWYTVVPRGQGQALISGHPEFCPQPVLVRIEGSTWGGSMLKLRFIGRGMHLEFRHPEYQTPIVTSLIQEVRECVSPTGGESCQATPAEIFEPIPLTEPGRRTSGR